MQTATALALAQDLGVLALFVVTPWLDVPAARRLRAHPDPAARLRLYRRGFIGLWLGFAYACFAAAGPARLWSLLRAPGEWTWLDHPLGLGAATFVCLAFAVAAMMPGVRGLQGPAQRARYVRAMQPLAFFLPDSPLQRRWWVALSVAAGVCEEFVFRGFLIHYFRGTLEGPFHLGLTSAVLMSTLAFGLGHAYQGVGGIVRTAFAGLIFALLTVLSGSLLLPIVLHVLADLTAIFVYRPDRDAADAGRGAAQAT